MTIYFFSHFLRAWLLPPAINIVIGLLGVFLLGRTKNILSGKIIILFAFVSLYILSMPIVARHLMLNLQNEFHYLEPTALNKNNKETAIVILGGGSAFSVEYDKKYSVNLETLSRLRYGAFLYHKIGAPIIVSVDRR
jgi:uncharacterized SAM-binding protein YcdF (DUF218 family)